MNELFKKLFGEPATPNVDKLLEDAECERQRVHQVIDTLDKNEERRKKLINRLGTSWEDMIREPRL